MTGAVRNHHYSKQREVIYRILAGTSNHPTAEWIFQRARVELPNISLGTVYRNLQLLRDLGRIREIATGPVHTRFDALMEPHHHFICTECGGMRDLFVQLPVDLIPFAQTGGVEVEGCRVEFYGKCEECAGEPAGL